MTSALSGGPHHTRIVRRSGHAAPGILRPPHGLGHPRYGLRAKDGIHALLALRRIVVKRLERPLAQQQDGDEVDDRHEAHEDVGEIPCEAEVVHRAKEDGGQAEQAEHQKHGLVVLDEQYVALGIEVIAHEGREREQNDARGHEVNANGANRIRHCHLHEIDAVEAVGSHERRDRIGLHDSRR